MARDSPTVPLLSLLLLSCYGLAFAAYDCPPICDVSPYCQCAYTSPPGELDPKDVPQFIVLTNDDAVTVVTKPVILNVTTRHNNSNGCPMPATWFVSIDYTDPALVQELYMTGHEIATHTVGHIGLPNATQILGAKLWLNQTAHVPLEKLCGFRAPFLAHDAAQRGKLQGAGLTWDSSISEMWGTNSASPNAASKVFPFTFDYGSPINCAVTSGTCSTTESHPGLWEFPLWDVQGDDGSDIASMDPPGNWTELYMREFVRNYNGNRAPLGIYLHAGAGLMAVPEHAEQLNIFLNWALEQDDVWVATISQVLDWMKNPVPASEYRLPCPTPADMWFATGKFCAAPSGGCVQGTWNPGRCACDCLNMYNTSSTGFCPDPSTGACTVQKPWDGSAFRCPGAADAPAAVVLHPQATPDVGHSPLDLAGLSLSASGRSGAAGDGASLWAEAFQAVDNLTSTCTMAAPSYGTTHLTVMLAEPYSLASLTLRMGSAAPGLQLLAGNDTSSGGLNNPVCMSGLSLAKGTTTVPCAATASVITLKASIAFSVCDVSLTVPALSSTSSSGSSSTATTTNSSSSTATATNGSSSTATTTNGSSSTTPTTGGSVATSSTGTTAEQVVDIQPVGGVEFSFAATGATVSDFANGKADSVCSVLKLLVLNKMGDQPVTACTITSVTTAATVTARRRRNLAASTDALLVVAALQTSRGSAVTAALELARSDGSLASELANIGLQLVATDGSSTHSASSNGTSVMGAAVGGAVGGVAVVLGITGTVLLVRRRRQRSQTGGREDAAERGASVKVKSSPVVKGLGPVAIVANARSRLGDEAGQASAYASGTPRSTGATPRAAARRGVPAEL